MDCVIDIKNVPIKQDMVSDYEEKWCNGDLLKEFGNKSAMLNVKTEQEELEEPTYDAAADLVMPVITKVETIQVKPEIFHNYEENIAEVEYRTDVQIDLSSESSLRRSERVKRREQKQVSSGLALDGTETPRPWTVGLKEQIDERIDDQVRRATGRRMVTQRNKPADITAIRRSDHEVDVQNVSTDTSHSSRTNKKSFICDKCDKRFNNRSMFIKHYAIHSVNNRHKCEVCLTCFRFKKELVNHYSKHTDYKPYKCDVCLKCFKVKNTLTVHYRTHTGEKPFKCDVCKKSFNFQGNLNVHYRIHTGEKPYKCEKCNQCFKFKANLDVHYRVHTSERLYTCDVCMKGFNYKANLEVHYRLHTGEKPYTCDVCGKGFSFKAGLNVHYRVHTGEKPYKCDVCMKTFNFQGNLSVHYRTHTDDKPFKCNVCMKCFTNKNGLNKHTDKKHKNAEHV